MITTDHIGGCMREALVGEDVEQGIEKLAHVD